MKNVQEKNGRIQLKKRKERAQKWLVFTLCSFRLCPSVAAESWCKYKQDFIISFKLSVQKLCFILFVSFYYEDDLL